MIRKIINTLFLVGLMLFVTDAFRRCGYVIRNGIV